jgi:predicted aspartyl protease
MNFSYVRYELDPTATIPAGEVCRPRIPIRVVGPKRSLQVFGLLDTGADHVFLSASIAKQLGIVPTADSETAHGAGGHEIDVWPGKVQIELTD